MQALLVLGIVFGSLSVYALGAATMANYMKNHVELWDGRAGEDTQVGVGFLAAFWPVALIPVVVWALGVRPEYQQRCQPFLWHLFTLDHYRPAPREVRKEIKRRKAINRAEAKAGQVPTTWQLPAQESAAIRSRR